MQIGGCVTTTQCINEAPALEALNCGIMLKLLRQKDANIHLEDLISEVPSFTSSCYGSKNKVDISDTWCYLVNRNGKVKNIQCSKAQVSATNFRRNSSACLPCPLSDYNVAIRPLPQLILTCMDGLWRTANCLKPCYLKMFLLFHLRCYRWSNVDVVLYVHDTVVDVVVCLPRCHVFVSVTQEQNETIVTPSFHYEEDEHKP